MQPELLYPPPPPPQTQTRDTRRFWLLFSVVANQSPRCLLSIPGLRDESQAMPQKLNPWIEGGWPRIAHRPSLCRILNVVKYGA
jgi:hypothetical protein